MSHITTEDPATLRLPFKEKLSYGIGDLASNILLDIGTLYLLKFYTDVLGLPGTYGGIIFLISKFFTAFTDGRINGNFPAPERFTRPGMDPVILRQIERPVATAFFMHRSDQNVAA